MSEISVPWFVGRDGDFLGHKHYGMREVVGPALKCVGFTMATNVDAGRDARIEADARLIAAAPELLAALKDAVDDLLMLSQSRWSEFEGTEDDLIGKARAAIAKAEGNP